MKLYTVDRGNLLEGLKILELSLENPLGLPYYTIEGLLEGNELQEHIKFLFPEGLSRHGWQYMLTRHTYGSNPNFQFNHLHFIEMNLENIRKAYFPKMPSRFQSIFASSSLEEAQDFRNRYGSVENQIYEVESSNFVKVDMNHIYLGVQNIAGSYICHKYWQGKSTLKPYFEYIVKLPVEVNGKVVE